MVKNISKIVKCLAFVFLFNSLAVSADNDDFQKNFNIAKQHLSKREILEAIPYLEYLRKQYPNNANLMYLVGLCYVEEEIINYESVRLLENSSYKASLEYNPNSVDENRVPIYVYYYLSVAYAQNGNCKKAELNREKFLEIYPHKDEYYINESKRWLDKCLGPDHKVEEDVLPTFSNFKPYISPKQNTQLVENSLLDEQNKKNQNLTKQYVPLVKEVKTKHVEYSTELPLYGVQLGAYKEAVPVSRFKHLKNVDAFMDKKGWIRYVIGHFSIASQANSLLLAIQEKGYPDAFIVNVNNEKKFSEEVISIDNVNIKSRINGEVIYKIQLGAFKENMPIETAKRYFQIDEIEEIKYGNLTCLVKGHYGTYKEAKAYLEGIRDMGIEDAFVIAVNNGKKISLQVAKDYEND